LPDMKKLKKDGIGARIAVARRAAGLSQRQVSEALGIPPRTFSYYESCNGDLPSSYLLPLADLLGVDVHDLLGSEAKGSRKSGPKGHLQERLDIVRDMPRQDQKFVVKFLDQVIDDYNRRRRNPPKSSS